MTMEAKFMSPDAFYMNDLSNNPKSKDFQFAIMKDKENQQITKFLPAGD